jgi:hypothetical protein
MMSVSHRYKTQGPDQASADTYAAKDLSRRNVAMPPYFHGGSGDARRSGERNGLGDTTIGP